MLNFLFNLFGKIDHARRTEKIVSGRDERKCSLLHSLPSIRERTLFDIGGIRMLAAACAAERGRDTGEMSSDPIRRESRALIAAANKTGCFVDASTIPGTRYTIQTGESEVRILQREHVYYKIKNPFAKMHLKKHPVEFVLLEHVAHNVLFPDCRLDFLGIAEDMKEARIVLRQEAVRSDVRPNDRQICEHLSRTGLMKDGRYSFGNDYVFVTDVGQDSDNVLLDDEGQLRFIDPVIGFKPPLINFLESILENDSTVMDLLSALYGFTDIDR